MKQTFSKFAKIRTLETFQFRLYVKENRIIENNFVEKQGHIRKPYSVIFNVFWLLIYDNVIDVSYNEIHVLFLSFLISFAFRLIWLKDIHWKLNFTTINFPSKFGTCRNIYHQNTTKTQ